MTCGRPIVKASGKGDSPRSSRASGGPPATGKVSAGNTFAVLLRVRGKGWRIAVASKGTRHEKPIRKA